MEILFLAPNYLGLHEPIICGLKEKGHRVVYVEDKLLPFYPYFRRNRINSILYNIIHFFRNTKKLYNEYWQYIIEIHSLKEYQFDVFFCINGTSLHSCFFSFISTHYPCIKKSLYLWDTNEHYDFSRNVYFFDKVFTFDRNDAQRLGVNYLPFYFFNSLKQSGNDNIKYDAFCIGTLHDNRLAVLEKIARQMDDLGLTYLFKVVCQTKTPSMMDFFIYYLRYFVDSKFQREERKYRLGLKTNKFLTSNIYTIEEYTNLMCQCKVVIDTDKPSQSGLTPRFVWALALGKRIITSNSHVEADPYCPEGSVVVFNRDNPIVTKDMFNDENVIISPLIKDLNLASWLDNFIDIVKQ